MPEDHDDHEIEARADRVHAHDEEHRGAQDRWPHSSRMPASMPRKEDWPPDAPDKPVMLVAEERVSVEAAERIRARLVEVTREIAEAEAGDVPVSVAIGFCRPRT